MAFRPSLDVLRGLLFYAHFLEFPWHGRVPFVGGMHARPTAWQPQLPQLQAWANGCGAEARNASRRGLNGTDLSNVFNECRKRHRGSFERAKYYCEWRPGDQSILNAYFSREPSSPER